MTDTDTIKAMPQDRAVRDRMRQRAVALAATLGAQPQRADLERLGARLLDEVGLSGEQLGFAMVCVSNAWWADRYSAVPTGKRLLLLPHCLRHADVCKGTYDANGLNCVECGACELGDLKRDAEALGYAVLIAEGGPIVAEVVLSGRADAVLGVACLDSLEKAFDRVAQFGVPHVAVPLLIDGCVDTIAELDLVRDWLGPVTAQTSLVTSNYLGLVRTARGLFESDRLAELLAPAVDLPARPASLRATHEIAVDWLLTGGKRLRPFVTLATYDALSGGGEIPEAVQRIAVAIEVLHKASLVHDDIEDGDLRRYGRDTLHVRYGPAVALNVGDHLIGLGTACVAAGRGELSDACLVDIQAMLARAHLQLCGGQGAELMADAAMPPAEVQAIYAMKTAPGFEAAMYAGARSAWGEREDADAVTRLRRFCRYLGVAFQVNNDLHDWARDIHADRPTLLRALAGQAGVAGDTDAWSGAGVFDKAHAVAEECRSRALANADDTELGELMRFIVEVVL